MNYSERVTKNISDSASDFLNVVWPAFKDVPGVGGGEILPMETEKDVALAKELDRRAGVDAWQLMDGQTGMRAIASRVNWGTDYRNFTVRYRYGGGTESEYFKRLYAIENPELGLAKPHLTIQAFVSERGGELLSAAAIPTEDLILQVKRLFDRGVIESNQDNRYGLRQGPDGTRFLYISWDYILSSEIAESLMFSAGTEADCTQETPEHIEAIVAKRRKRLPPYDPDDPYTWVDINGNMLGD